MFHVCSSAWPLYRGFVGWCAALVQRASRVRPRSSRSTPTPRVPVLLPAPAAQRAARVGKGGVDGGRAPGAQGHGLGEGLRAGGIGEGQAGSAPRRAVDPRASRASSAARLAVEVVVPAGSDATSTRRRPSVPGAGGDVTPLARPRSATDRRGTVAPPLLQHRLPSTVHTVAAQRCVARQRTPTAEINDATHLQRDRAPGRMPIGSPRATRGHARPLAPPVRASDQGGAARNAASGTPSSRWGRGIAARRRRSCTWRSAPAGRGSAPAAQPAKIGDGPARRPGGEQRDRRTRTIGESRWPPPARREPAAAPATSTPGRPIGQYSSATRPEQALAFSTPGRRRTRVEAGPVLGQVERQTVRLRCGSAITLRPVRSLNMRFSARV